MAPTLRRLGLYWLADPKHYVTAETVVKFLRDLLEHLRGKVIVVWDGGSNHKGLLIRELCARYSRLHLERWPAYAPDLNPVEQVWSHLKYGRRPNFVPESLAHLDQTVRAHLQSVGQTPNLLKALWHGSELSFPLSIFT